MSAHERAINRFGGHDGIHSLDLLEAAVARPYTGYYRFIHSKAAALLQSVATNHAFVDGNKRTALMLFYLLLEKSGYELRQTSISEEDDIEHLILDLTVRFLDFDEIGLWLRIRIRPSR